MRKQLLLICAFYTHIAFSLNKEVEETEPTLFTTQVLSWNEDRNQRTKLETAKRNEVFQNQQLIMDHNQQANQAVAEPEFLAQGSTFGKKGGFKGDKSAKGPKWHLGAGMYMNKDVNKGATVKETTFIPVKPIKQPTVVKEEKQTEDYSSSGSSSDDDEEDLKKKLLKRKKKKFSLFSVNDLVDSVNVDKLDDYGVEESDEEIQEFQFGDDILSKLVVKVVDNSTNITTFKYTDTVLENDDASFVNENADLASKAVNLSTDLLLMVWLLIAII
ncbi:uncharacterized protein KGF55_001699 [Candida pseudojiufengensis]|uniref:uncharacterized protein n=1 Tax=Candida pseudojiufengensis TaxID=497109 RepID=UPI002224137B|nr:uncharacterized protein KGF55_001699 [Candida pseudojiufengensis]KAI5964630.1 hypothetical protein KGF55_001699 [Candida pseudojiufengensis]